MSTILSNTDFADISVFANEVRKAFETAIPPIIFSINKKEDVESFAQQLQSDKGFLGKRVSCKHAKSGSFGTFSLNELYSFESERYPIQLSFKQLKECEDFANGWLRIIEKENAPVEEPEPTPPIVETTTPNENNPISEESAQTQEPKEKPSLEDDSMEYSVNPLAENILDRALKGVLILGWILAAGALIAGIAFAAEWEDGAFLLICLAAPLILLFSYHVWARGKILINISRNLFKIRSRLNDK